MFLQMLILSVLYVAWSCGLKMWIAISHKQVKTAKTTTKTSLQQHTTSLTPFWPHLLYGVTSEQLSTHQGKNLLLSPNLLWSIRDTMSILHASVWVQFISCLYCYKCWAHSKLDEMGGVPDTIYSAGRDTSPWLPNGFLHFTQLFPLRKSYQYRLLLRQPENPQHMDTVP